MGISDDIKNNFRKEKDILKKIDSLGEGSRSQKKVYDSLKTQLKILNNALSSLLERYNFNKELGDKKVDELISHKGDLVKISKEDKKEFLKALNLTEGVLKGSKDLKNEKKVNGFSMSSLSNKLFKGVSSKLAPGFSDLKKDLIQSNSGILLTKYISTMLFFSILIFIVSLVVLVGLVFVFPNSIYYFWVCLVLPFLVFGGFYIYPSLRKGAVDKGISNELPFVAIHMAAISGSDIEPVKIFRIVSMSKEYKYIGKEFKKIINQIDVYGYDLVSSLKNLASSTINSGLAELLKGMATNISTGGALRDYLDKKAENLLVDYRLERERYSAVVETFMDIYISVMITAPMIFMMVFVIMFLVGTEFSFSINVLTIIVVFVLIIVNIIFLTVLHLKQPKT
jgi:pilus assembly protein TadC